MNKIINNFFKETYGKNESEDKSKLIFGGILLLLSAGAILYLVKYAVINKIMLEIDQIVGLFLCLMFFSVALLIVTIYYIEKKSEPDKYKCIKIGFFIFSILLFIIIMLPVAIFYKILNKTKTYNLYTYSTLLGLISIIDIILVYMLSILTYIFLSQFECIKVGNTSIFLAFIISYLLLLAMINIYFRIKIKLLIRKNKQKDFLEHIKVLDEDFKNIKQELYLLNFVIIAFCTAAFYFINIPYPYKLDDKTLYAFTLYMAFDTVYSKWKDIKINNEKQKIQEGEIKLLKNKVEDESEQTAIIVERLNVLQKELNDLKMEHIKLKEQNNKNKLIRKFKILISEKFNIRLD